MKSEIYFRHDVYTLDDTAIMELVFRHHEAGYGVFWATVERLTAEPEHKMPLQVLARQIAMKLSSAKPSKVEEILRDCVGFGLLKEADGVVFSERVIRQCEKVENYSRTQAENVKKRWERYHTNTTVEAPNNQVPAVEPQAKQSQGQKHESNKERASRLVERYHELCPSLPKVLKLTDARITHACTFLDCFDPDEIAEGLKRAEASDFMRNGNGTWNGANFDWLTNKNNFAKVLEGQYANREQRPRSQSSVCNDAQLFRQSQNGAGGFDL